MENPIRETAAAALADLGLSAPANVIQTMLMHDGYFLGWEIRYDGGHAILHANSGVTEFFDEQGTMPKRAEREAA